jgi:hypothetical protein
MLLATEVKEDHAGGIHESSNHESQITNHKPPYRTCKDEDPSGSGQWGKRIQYPYPYTPTE